MYITTSIKGIKTANPYSTPTTLTPYHRSRGGDRRDRSRDRDYRRRSRSPSGGRGGRYGRHDREDDRYDRDGRGGRRGINHSRSRSADRRRNYGRDGR